MLRNKMGAPVSPPGSPSLPASGWFGACRCCGIITANEDNAGRSLCRSCERFEASLDTAEGGGAGVKEPQVKEAKRDQSSISGSCEIDVEIWLGEDQLLGEIIIEPLATTVSEAREMIEEDLGITCRPVQTETGLEARDDELAMERCVLRAGPEDGPAGPTGPACDDGNDCTTPSSSSSSSSSSSASSHPTTTTIFYMRVVASPPPPQQPDPARLDPKLLAQLEDLVGRDRLDEFLGEVERQTAGRDPALFVLVAERLVRNLEARWWRAKAEEHGSLRRESEARSAAAAAAAATTATTKGADPAANAPYRVLRRRRKSWQGGTCSTCSSRNTFAKAATTSLSVPKGGRRASCATDTPAIASVLSLPPPPRPASLCRGRSS